ncbi:hypothetical protein M1I95_21755 [Rossellomorea marisflavi]|uniref:hypothetical protein n=1 Tax=Rossellomorea marisflavi TaxID=189381 RepID=UPI002798F770|nr:hypothetical protein [Rossellomorea marisflavi]UTE72818.1 hypothetical protein M1I95_21755 [Rossellomorea marisflavi]
MGIDPLKIIKLIIKLTILIFPAIVELIGELFSKDAGSSADKKSTIGCFGILLGAPLIAIVILLIFANTFTNEFGELNPGITLLGMVATIILIIGAAHAYNRWID